MPLLTGNTISIPVLIPSVRSNGQCRGETKIKSSAQMVSMQFKPLDGSRGQIKAAESCPVAAKLQPINKRRSITHSTQMLSASIICNAALNARCNAAQTQTLTRESPTITISPTHGKEKSPKLDEGGTGFPPYHGGGGGGGGGGDSFSGGFFLFGFLGFLGFLKDLEGEGHYRRDRRS